MAIELKIKVMEHYPYYFIKEYTFIRGNRKVARNLLDRTGALIKGEGVVPDGIVKEFYPSGKVMAQYHYKDGCAHGPAKMYYESGEIMKELNYIAGKKDGLLRQFHRGGAVWVETVYRTGLIETGPRYYDDHGKPASLPVSEQHQPGEIVRVIAREYPNQRASEIAFLRDGHEIARQFWDINGNEVSIEGAIPDGLVREYFASGQIRGEWQYRRGRPEGTARLFHENGGIEAEIAFQEGHRAGPLREYYPDGTLLTLAKFDEGRAVSVFKYEG